jgi:hypothetical protein
VLEKVAKRPIRPTLPRNIPISPKDLERQQAIQTQDSVKKRLSQFWRLTRDQLQDLLSHPDTTMGDLALASILVAAAKEGDQQKLQFVLDRMIGKVKPTHDKISEHEMLTPIPTERLLALVRDLPDYIDVKGS